jgi:hypothetical protein
MCYNNTGSVLKIQEKIDFSTPPDKNSSKTKKPLPPILVHREELVVKLPDNTIFVFGSNLSGIHGAGAAAIAAFHFGAKDRQGQGLFGQSYALPTKGYKIEIIPISQVQEYITNFFNFVSKYVTHSPDTYFYLTRVGCGLGGHKENEIAIARSCPYHPNVIYPESWAKYIVDLPLEYRNYGVPIS